MDLQDLENLGLYMILLKIMVLIILKDFGNLIVVEISGVLDILDKELHFLMIFVEIWFHGINYFLHVIDMLLHLNGSLLIYNIFGIQILYFSLVLVIYNNVLLNGIMMLS